MVVLVGVGVNPSKPDRCPYWKIHTMAPKTAVRLRKLSTRALIGSTTLPVNSHSTTQRGQDDQDEGERQPAPEVVLLVDEPGRTATHVGRDRPGTGRARTWPTSDWAAPLSASGPMTAENQLLSGLW